MTLTKKVGLLLLLLTLASLIGSASFTLFLARTSSDGLFLVASTMKQNLLQQLYVDAYMVRNNDNDARVPLANLTDDFDRLLDAMVFGGTETRAGKAPSALDLVQKLSVATTDSTMDNAASTQKLIRLAVDGLPVPSEDFAVKSRAFRDAWLKVRDDFATVAATSVNDPKFEEAFARIQANNILLQESSRAVTSAVMRKLLKQRENLLTLLASISGLSIFLFIAGLWFAKRYITRPIQEIERASARARSGDFSVRIPIASNDELAALARTFNQMSEEINRLIERYRELFENAADFVYTADLAGTFLSVNKAGEQMSGYSREELLSMRLAQLLIPEQGLLLRDMLKQKMSGEQQTTTYEVEMVARDGHHVFVENSTRLIFENGTAVAIQGVGRDVTERKKLQEQLWMAQKMDAVGRLASGIAHDFGNILTIITGYCALILAVQKPGDPLRAEVEGIQRAAQRAASLIRHLLGFSSGQVFRPRVINLDAVLTEMIEMLRRLIGEDTQLVTKLGPSLGFVRMDPAQLEQVIVNLALNSRDAMPGGGALHIEAADVDLDDHFVRIRITDSGVGIAPEVLSRIFEPFFTTKDHGTGLGLSIIHSIIHQNGGSISVESQLGKGTTFTILLPRVTVIGDIPDADSLLARPKRGEETVLLVEDEVDVRTLVREMLSFYGYHVVEAESQKHALDLCSRHDLKLDLLLTDVVMPNMSGPELAQEIALVRPGLKVIYMSGHTRDRFARTGINVETVNFIQKPIAPEVLTAKIREVLETSGNGSYADTAG